MMENVVNETKEVEKKEIDLSRPVDFSYPKGFMEVAELLDFLPDQRSKMMAMTIFTMSFRK